MKSIRRHFFSADSFFAILLDNQMFIKVYSAMQHISSNVGSIRLERIRQEVMKKAEKSRVGMQGAFGKKVSPLRRLRSLSRG